jgi:DnaK suppressor protein
MSQPDMFSQSPAKASSIVHTDALEPNGDSLGNTKEIVITPRTGRKTPSVPKVHCFEFNALLQAQRRLLLAEVRAKISVSGESPGFAHQSAILEDDALADAAAEMDLGKVIRVNRQLRDIEFALARIRDGSYGICVDCGGDISRARLKVDPTAKRCLSCQAQALAVSPTGE